MRKALTLSTALGVVMLLGGPAFAQSGQSNPSSSVAPLGAQEQASNRAEHRMMSMHHEREATRLLRLSDQAVSSGNWSRANEYLERAQTTALNEEAMGGGVPSQPQAAGLPGFEQAQQAMRTRNKAEAHSALQQAMAGAEQMGNTATGSTSATQPMYGGGQTSSMQPRGGMGTAGPSPYGSAQGTATMPNRVQPGTSALNNVQGRDVTPRGAPAPGQPFPRAGAESTGISSGGQVRPGSPTLGGGTGGSTAGTQGP